MSIPQPPLPEPGIGLRSINVQRNRSKASTRQNIPNRGPMLTAAMTGNLDAKVVNVPQEEFDEYGAELEPDARVWKTYVKEADKFDMEQVEGWNRSLDVTLIFAALFTAICTAFVIESSKSLKEDPTETSARRLDQIASILLVVAGANDLSQLNSTEIMAPIASEPFSPRPVDLCVNVLWFFSLILSAAVSLIAMLAKEWCYLFMSGRIGDPWSQTKRRQQRWEGIEKWKMEQVIIFLPSFIHLSFLSFAAGICLYLGDLSLGVAIPAAFVALGSMLIYVASTVLPLLKGFKTICPYSTSISRFLQRKKVNNKNPDRDSEETGRITVEALAWLIKTSEDPKSTDIALQAVAGADPDIIDQRPLKACEADTMISRRLIALDSYANNYEQISDLYTRAQSFFQPSSDASTERKVVSTSIEITTSASTEKVTGASTEKVARDSAEKVTPKSNLESKKNSGGGPHQKDLHRGLQKKIRSLRDTINGQITGHVTSSEHIFLSTPDNIQALRVGSTAASHCLRSLQNGIQNQTQELFHSAIDLLESYRNRDAHLSPKEIEYLMIGIAMLLSSLLVNCELDIGAEYALSLLRLASRAGKRQKQLRLDYLGLPLIVYALSRHDYPGWTRPPPLSPISRAERAIDVIAHYVHRPAELGSVSSVMINLALLELLSNPEGYKLNDGDIITISESFDEMNEDVDQARIYTFPEGSHPDTFSRTLNSMATMVSKNRGGLRSRDDAAIACLTVLNCTRMDQPAPDAPVGQVYAFVIECVLSLPSSGPEAYGQNVALDLIQKFRSYSSWTPGHTLDLVQSLDRRDTITKLKQATKLEANDTNFVIKLFAVGQAWFLIDLAIGSEILDEQDWKCLSPFVEDGSLWDSPESITQRLEEQRDILEKQYKSMWEGDSYSRHEYFKTIYHSLPQVDKSASDS